jgi:flavin-dependent dehydrogenase
MRLLSPKNTAVIYIKVDIVGGSLAGLSTAISLKKHNAAIDVIVHEKYKEIGYNHEGRRCGEAHSIEAEWKKWRPEGKSVFNPISTVITYYGNKQKVLQRLPGTSCILNRQEFIAQLGTAAAQLGVVIKTNDKITSVDELDGDYIVDASGCPSIIKRGLGIDHGLKGVTYQQTLEESNWFIADTVKIFLTGSIGYYWVFPRDPNKKEINLGMGIIGTFSGNLKQMLEEFKKQHEIQGRINYILGGLIPMGLQKPFMYKNIIFVGDTAVGTFPLTGQGIYRALLSGDTAGRLLAQNKIKRYSYTLNQMFIKWDIIGKNFVRMNHHLQKIGPHPVLLAMEYLDKFYGVLH